MNTEARTIRPFVAFGDIEAILEGATLVFGNDVCLAGSRIVFGGGHEEFRASSIVLAWASEAEFGEQIEKTLDACPELGIPPEALSLVVVAVSKYLKDTDVVYEHPLTALADLPRVVDLVGDTRAPAFDAVHHGFAVDAMVVLNQALEPRPLYPHRLGTWLARAQFSVATESISSLFRPTPLTDELRTQMKLGARVTRYVRLDEHDPLAPFDEQPEPILYVDEEILARTVASPKAPASRAMQLGLVMEFVRSVVTTAARSEDLESMTFGDAGGSVVARLIEFAAPNDDDFEKQRIFSEISSDPDWVVAYIEHALNVRKPLIADLEGSES